jgi:hypothetical protein
MKLSLRRAQGGTPVSKHGGRGGRGDDRDDRIVQVVVAAQAQNQVETTTAVNVTTQTEEDH